ncbi:PEPxxWA-CTERM sorting domain-containing protein [Sandarakinorhabdus sp.]|uniref:PEPxxWA-CTERM sorting domain-containing protein n=1 Tax=Sandarakinorhabdus sp. TaxID=1916663 RepID=UPI0033417B71
MMFRFAAALAALTLATAPAQAVITSITLSGGTAFTAGGTGQIIAAPATSNIATGNNIVGFNEVQSTSLVNTLGLGNLAPQGFIFATNSNGNIVSPVGVSSHFFLFNTTGKTASGTITFNQNVIALQRISFFVNSPRSNQLETGATDFSSFGVAQGLEVADLFTLIDPKTLSFSLTTPTNVDGFRVITAVPEASTWVMLLAGFGMVGAAARRRKTVVAA